MDAGEQHEDAPDRMHVVVYSKKPFLKKSSNNNSPALKAGIKANEIPAIEVKSSNDTFLFVSGSAHKDGFPFKIIGTKEPVVCDDFENHIDNICRKYHIPYLDADNGNGKALLPMQELGKKDFVVCEGNNRHEALMRKMESLIKRNRNVSDLEEIQDYARRWNEKHCLPPLDDIEFDKQWKCALEFIGKKIQEETFFTQQLRKKAEHEHATTDGGGGAGGPGSRREILSDEEKEILESRIDTMTQTYKELELINTPEEAVEMFHIKTTRPDKEIYCYNKDNGLFEPNGNIVIEKQLEYSSKMADSFYNPIHEMVEKLYADIEDDEKYYKAISNRMKRVGVSRGEDWSKHKINEFLGHVERQTYFYRNGFNPNIEWIACEDCMVNLLTGDTADFDPKYLNTTQIPVKYYVYEPSPIGNTKLVECPKMLKFLNEIVGPTEKEMILDFAAFCLWRDYKFHNWMLLNGYGQNGKSTFLYFLEKFLGTLNISSESLQRILERNFSSAQLYGKLANIDADLSSKALTNTGLLKKLTGGDRLTAEYKNKPLFDFTNYAKLIFSANEIPMTSDITNAFYRRLIIINFTKQFFGDKNNPNLKYEITTEAELSGFLRLVLKRLPRILKEGLRPTTNETIARTQDQYLMSANPIKYFVNKALTPIPAGEKYTPKTEVYDAYERFCRHHNLPIISEQSFSQALTSNEYGFHYKLSRQYNKGKGKGKNLPALWCWIDFRLSDWVGTPEENQLTLEDLKQNLGQEEEEDQDEQTLTEEEQREAELNDAYAKEIQAGKEATEEANQI